MTWRGLLLVAGCLVLTAPLRAQETGVRMDSSADIAGELPPELLGADVVSGEEASTALDVKNVKLADDGIVSGILVNRTSEPIGNVRLMIRYNFLWKRERSPGKRGQNPSFVVFHDVDETVAPGKVVPFAHVPDEPLPQRKDGRFQPFVEVFRYGSPPPPGPEPVP